MRCINPECIDDVLITIGRIDGDVVIINGKIGSVSIDGAIAEGEDEEDDVNARGGEAKAPDVTITPPPTIDSDARPDEILSTPLEPNENDPVESVDESLTAAPLRMAREPESPAVTEPGAVPVIGPLGSPEGAPSADPIISEPLGAISPRAVPEIMATEPELPAPNAESTPRSIARPPLPSPSVALPVSTAPPPSALPKAALPEKIAAPPSSWLPPRSLSDVPAIAPIVVLNDSEFGVFAQMK